jgi:hypothetical protein
MPAEKVTFYFTRNETILSNSFESMQISPMLDTFGIDLYRAKKKHRHHLEYLL